MSLLIYCGLMAYNFLHRNLQAALPSLRTMQSIVCHDYKPFCKGKLRFDDLVEYLKVHKAVKVVAVGEDATGFISRVEYDSESNKFLGLSCIVMTRACHFVTLSPLSHLSQWRRLSETAPLPSMPMFTWCSLSVRGFLHFVWPV